MISYISLIIIISILVISPVVAFAEKDLKIKLFHDGIGTVKICFKAKIYKTLCFDKIDLEQYISPGHLIIDLDKSPKGEKFKICYSGIYINENTCEDFRFNGKTHQYITIDLRT